jgi:TolB-like protein
LRFFLADAGRVLLAGAALAALSATSLGAQCPDGSPPPCARATPARAPAAPDPHRIAILPFRVSGADTSLGEGFGELLSAEFTGESGPRAVHMGTVIRAWRQAGGGAAVPLSQPVASRIARQLGAGYFVDGSIVGLGNRLTVTASVVSVTDGQSRRAEPIRGSADSLDVLLSRLTTTLLALAGGESREGSRGVLTSSPTAIRAYLDGMSQWRRTRREEATTAFERAFREDTTFARAALMRFWIANWFGEPVSGQWARTVFALRGRLSSADRLLVVALLGEGYPTPRAPAVSFGDRQRAAALLPESPEAQYLAGDWLFHYGASIDATDAIERARGYFTRSFALDSQQTVLAHLVDVATLLADTALLRSLQPVLEARATDMGAVNWLAAGYLGDRAWMARPRGDNGLVSLEAMGLLPANTIDRVTTQRSAITRGPDAALLAHSLIAGMQGRPAVARVTLDSVADTMLRDQLTALEAVVGDRDTANGAAAVRSLEAATGLDSNAAGRRDCTVALWHEWLDDHRAATIATSREDLLNCAAMVALLHAWHAGAPDLPARLEAADSLIRGRISPSRYQGYENFVLARIWEAHGNRRRALSAIRLYPIGIFAVIGLGPRLREEGRLAASVGDIDRAIQAYRLYLEYRKDAEPALQPERDSVRAVMASLVRP